MVNEYLVKRVLNAIINCFQLIIELCGYKLLRVNDNII